MREEGNIVLTSFPILHEVILLREIKDWEQW
jgi:hypothetical protein